jgi:hypothetical protein
MREGGWERFPQALLNPYVDVPISAIVRKRQNHPAGTRFNLSESPVRERKESGFLCETMKKGEQRVSFFPAEFVNVSDLTKWLRRAGVNVNDASASTLSDLYEEMKAGKSKLVLQRATTGRQHLESPTPRKQEVVRVLHVTNLVVLDPEKKLVLVEALREKSWKKIGRKVKKGQLPSIKLNRFQENVDSTREQFIFKAAANLLGKELQLPTKWVNLRRSTVHTEITERASKTFLSLKGQYNVHSIFVDTNPQSDLYAWRTTFSDKPRLSSALAVTPEEQERLQKRVKEEKEREAKREKMMAAIAAAEPFMTEEKVKEGTVVHHWEWVPVGHFLNKKARKALGIPEGEKHYHNDTQDEAREQKRGGQQGVRDFLRGRQRMGGGSPKRSTVLDADPNADPSAVDMDGKRGGGAIRGARAAARQHILDYGGDKRGAAAAAAACSVDAGYSSLEDSDNDSSSLSLSFSGRSIVDTGRETNQGTVLPRLGR